MKRIWGLLAVVLFAVNAANAMKVDWVRNTGQFPVEATPLLIEQHHTPRLLAVNRKGQLMVWNLDGTDYGKGADGVVAELPQGFWSSSPAVVECPEGQQIVVCNDAGTVVALDSEYKPIWTHALPGGLVYGMAKPVLLHFPQGPVWGFADKTGTVTCLDSHGNVVWQRKLDAGECLTGVVACPGPGDASLLVSAGSRLFRLNKDGGVVWSTDLGAKITLRPDFFQKDKKSFLVCGTETGEVCALDSAGGVLWRTALKEELSGIASFTSTQMVVNGLWGNLHVLDMEGRVQWTHLFSGKARSCPVILDVDRDGKEEILTTGYHQHARVYDANGNLKDDMRLNGAINGSPLLIRDAHGRPQGVVAVTTLLLAYYLKPGAPVSPYGQTEVAQSLAVSCPCAENPALDSGVVVDNPKGALLRINLASQKETDSRRWVRGVLTARSLYEIPLIEGCGNHSQDIQVEALNGKGRKTCQVARSFSVATTVSDKPVNSLSRSGTPASVKLDNVYQGEVEAGTFQMAPGLSSPYRVRLETKTPVTTDGKSFAGTITLREAVLVGTVNGERVADALCPLEGGSLVQLIPGQPATVWVSVDATGALPGKYTGKITVTPIVNEVAPFEVPLEITVLDLALTRPFPLRLCTWDYIPNNWFPSRTEAVIDDMVQHGVNIFPRTGSVPKATMSEDGKLVFDWKTLEADLALFKGKGQLLFQVAQPPITFPATATDSQKHEAGLAYLRQWRDYLKEHGWGYEDYAFYPVDEPGFSYGNCVKQLLESAAWFREADPKLRIYTDPVPTLSKVDFEKIRSFIDVWCPNMRLVTGMITQDARMQWIHDSQKPVWSYECVGQVRSISPLRYNRANAWRGYAWGLQGIGFWTYCTTPTDPWLPGKTVDDEYALVYPGPLPVPSVRWEAVRDGLEDVAALDLLKKTAASKANMLPAKLKQAVSAEIRLAERDILDLSDDAFRESRDFLKQGNRRIWHTETDVTLYAKHRTAIAELTLAIKAIPASCKKDRK